MTLPSPTRYLLLGTLVACSALFAIFRPIAGFTLISGIFAGYVLGRSETGRL